MTRTPVPRLDAVVRSLLRESIPRTCSPPLDFSGTGTAPELTDSNVRAAAAVGAMVVWKLVQHGGSCLPVGPASRAAEGFLETFAETDRHRLEKEAAEIFHWLEDALNLLGDEWKGLDDRGMYPWEDREFADEGTTDLIRKALREKVDLEIDYFTYRRNAMTHRRITPLELEGEDRLRARCHWRNSERAFALRRIKQARLIGTDGT